MHTFFSRVRVHQPGWLPQTGAVLIVSNHHSSLVDPVALLATMPRLPRFLAKAALWDAKYVLLRPLLRLARAIPVHRHVDGGGDNTSMFAASHEVLENGDVIALFAEGVSHNMPGLLDLKTGAARIALGADVAVAVVPVGLIYDDRARFRSRAMIYIGAPLAVRGLPGGDDDRERVRELTALIAQGLDAVAPTWENWEAHNGAVTAARLTAADAPGITMGQALTAINRAVSDDSLEGRQVLEAVAELEAESARLGLDIEAVVERPSNQMRRLNPITMLLTAALFFPTALGRLVNLPPHELIRVLAGTQDLNFQATSKILLAIVLYPAWWVLLAGVTGVVLHPVVGIVVLVAVPLLGYIAARGYGRLRRFRNREIVRGATADHEHGEWQLIALRHAVLNATERVLAMGQGADEGTGLRG